MGNDEASAAPTADSYSAALRKSCLVTTDRTIVTAIWQGDVFLPGTIIIHDTYFIGNDKKAGYPARDTIAEMPFFPKQVWKKHRVAD